MRISIRYSLDHTCDRKSFLWVGLRRWYLPSDYFFGVCSWRTSLGGYWAEKGGISVSLSYFHLSLAIGRLGGFDLGSPSPYLTTSTTLLPYLLCFTVPASCNWDSLACA